MLARAAIVYAVLVEKGEATRDELIACVRQALGPDAYGASPRDSLHNDLAWLERLGFEVGVLPDYRYRLVRLAPLFPLPLTRQHVETLAAVRHALSGTLYGETIEALVANLRPFLDPGLRPVLDEVPPLRLSVPSLDNLAPHQPTLDTIRRACQQRRRVSFAYTSLARAEGGFIQHTIEPESLEEREGHIYFEGYSPQLGDVVQFRLDRVVPGSAELLPDKFPAGRHPRLVAIRYRLSPAVARFGASRRFERQAEKLLEDGWVEVTGEARSLFWAAKTLLKYGEHCIVIEPPELVAEMGRIVVGMARNYGLSEWNRGGSSTSPLRSGGD